MRCGRCIRSDAPYTYWDYGPAFESNRGLRIDHMLLSPELAERLTACGVDTAARAEDAAERPRARLVRPRPAAALRRGVRRVP